MTYNLSAALSLVYVTLGLMLGGVSLSRAAQKSQDAVQRETLAKISKAMFLATIGPSLGILLSFVIMIAGGGA